MKIPNSTTRLRLKRIALSIPVIILIFTGSLFLPWNVGALTSHPHPAQSYAEAMQRIQAFDLDHASRMNPRCLTQFMTHGQKVEHAIILVHGYTSCPAQFQKLGQRFYNLGYNVLIAPLPHHGLADRLTDEQERLTAKELTQYADEVVDIAQGLGDHVSILGISAGGVTTAWAAQHRSDIDLAVIISPAFGFKQIPTPITAPVMNAYAFLPNSYEWWDPLLQTQAGPAYAYPRYSKHALAETLQLGFAVQMQARRNAPATQKIIVVTNANDTAVNNSLTVKVVAHWQSDGAQIETYEFPLSLGLGHDLIDPEQPDQQIDIVYPQLIELVTQ
jgi:esterase/lipase